MIPHLTLQGDQDLVKRLTALSGALSTQVLTAALTGAAEPMRSRMASLAPRASRELHRPNRAPGHLADHIVVSRARTVAGERVAEGAAAVAIGPAKDYWWGIFSEFGTAHESARAFMRPAYDSTVDLSMGLITEEIWIRLRETAETGSFTPSAASGGGLL